mgnify:FL=1
MVSEADGVDCGFRALSMTSPEVVGWLVSRDNIAGGMGCYQKKTLKISGQPDTVELDNCLWDIMQ